MQDLNEELRRQIDLRHLEHLLATDTYNAEVLVGLLHVFGRRIAQLEAPAREAESKVCLFCGVVLGVLLVVLLR